MKLIVRLVSNQRCQGCGAAAWVEEKTLLCCACFGLKLAVEMRRQKIEGTLRARFAALASQVRDQLRELRG